jgi:hypothetical protein
MGFMSEHQRRVNVAKRKVDAARRRKSIKEARRAKVATLYHRGMMLKDIAIAVKAGRTTVYEDIQELHRQWVERADTEIDKAKIQQLQRLAWVEDEMSAEWEKSKQPGLTELDETTTGEDGDTRKHRRTVQHQTGNPKYMDSILKCVSERSKIMGLYAPVKVESTDREGKAPAEIKQIFEGMSEKGAEDNQGLFAD